MIDFSVPKTFRSRIDLPRLDLVVTAALAQCGYAQTDAITLKLTDNKAIRKLNQQYRGLDEATDILSFENDYLDLETGRHYLGDIVISYEKAAEQAQHGGHAVQAELEMLLVHGVLHLCGYDHLENADLGEMSALQDQILREIGNPLLGSISTE